MNKRLRFALVILLLAVFGLAAWFEFRSQAPTFRGKRLSTWTSMLDNGYYVDWPDEEQARAAVLHLDTNAIPWLLREIESKERPMEGFQKWQYDHDVLITRFPVAHERRRAAVAAFRVLGHRASPAIPRILEMCASTNGDLRGWAFSAIGAIGDEAVLPTLIHWLSSTNSELQHGAVSALGGFRSAAAPTVPQLVSLLGSNSPSIRLYAIRLLGDIASNPELTVPALINEANLVNGANDPHGFVRRTIFPALAQFGSQAAAAIPVLRQATGDPNHGVRFDAAEALVRVQCEMRDGGIIRGPKDHKLIAMVFTGHEYAEGGTQILTELEKRHAKASFFLTGDFLSNTNHRSLIARMVEAKHYLGPHSDKHLLYCEWDAKRTTRVTREHLITDLEANRWKIEQINERESARYFIPPYEHYNREIVDWVNDRRFTLINFTPGTRSNADYTGEADKNFVSSQAIFDSIVKKEREDPHGLNGFILLLHLGSGPGRKDKFHHRFGELLDYLSGKGYQFVRVDQLLEP